MTSFAWKSKDELKIFSGPELVKMYNLATGKKIKKFQSRAEGIKRLWDYAEKNGNAGPHVHEIKPPPGKTGIRRARRLYVAGPNKKYDELPPQAQVFARLMTETPKTRADLLILAKADIKTVQDLDVIFKWYKNRLQKEGFMVSVPNDEKKEKKA